MTHVAKVGFTPQRITFADERVLTLSLETQAAESHWGPS